MEGRISGGGGCCIARYGHHHGPTQTHYNPYGPSKMEQIMFRFRPIAPKPVVGGGPTPPTTTSKSEDNSPKRKKRSSATGNTDSNGCGAGGGGGKRRRKSSSPPNHQLRKSDDKVTLPLLPEAPDLSPKMCNHSNNRVGQPSNKSVPTWLCFGPSEQTNQTSAVEVVGSSVIVEGVTDTWMDGNTLGRTDEERKRRLEEDTCPGFISDAWNRVRWTNGAYRRMVAGEDDDDATWRREKMVVVKLEMKEKVELPAVKLFPAITCRVKVQYGKQGRESMTVPCDAWRMDCGGFAWRLDIKAALSLGR